MGVKVSKAQVPTSAKHHNSTSPQQRPEDANQKQRPHNDSLPHQKRQELRFPKQRQVDISMPAQRKPEDALPRNQPRGRTSQASAPSGTRPGGQLGAKSAAFMSAQSQGPTTDSKRALTKEATSATPATYPAAHTAPGRDSGSGVSHAGAGQAYPSTHSGGKQSTQFTSPEVPSQRQQGLDGLRTDTQEAASPLQSAGMAAPGPEPAHGQRLVQLTAGQEVLQELLDKAAAAPAQHSIAGTSKTPASRYAVQQGMLEGYFEVSPAPTPCEGYYIVSAQPEEHSSQVGTRGGPR